MKYNITVESVMQEVNAKIALQERLYGIKISDEREAEMIMEATEQLCYSNQLFALNEVGQECLCI